MATNSRLAVAFEQTVIRIRWQGFIATRGKHAESRVGCTVGGCGLSIPSW